MNRTKLNEKFNELHFDALISEAPQTRLWYAEVATSDGYIIIEKEKAYLFVDARYIEYCQKNAKNVEVILLKPGVLKEFLAKKKYQTIAYEDDYLKVETLKSLESLSPNAKSVFLKGQELRIVKSDDEIEKMQKAIDISMRAYNRIVSWLKEGMSEKEVDRKLNFFMKQEGADKESFDNIIAFGPNAAEPHHHPTDRKLVYGDIVKIDFGALYKGYSADITRTHIFGGKENASNPKLVEIMTIVEEAAKKGRDAVKPGMTGAQIDQICRDYITEKGYGEYFAHSTGHGLGIDVHELPYVSSRSHIVFEPGMVVTVEPGIYIEGLGGARDENDVLVTAEGHRVLSYNIKTKIVKAEKK
ncbi:Xaa-Pro aminopeptidase [Mycoplasmopsis californica]|uniref:Aminopeptidase P family protein n=1 Tax=Mycoplasmopsis equigenitalium TaxID=114883 RepID=A0ABY5J1V7_9BACT|nr:aminopeptidase P family protein [Mycoplasmopsis equigenitalium]UUD37247.1 aminopeptidase P family protein [Mycoplasmopsis equigenitalium]VEU69445.1 Xaa-Pro aminopeptidase [Mycoplasmopsis californica]